MKKCGILTSVLWCSMLLYGMDREEGASAAVSELNDSVIGNSEASLRRLALAIDVDNETL